MIHLFNNNLWATCFNPDGMSGLTARTIGSRNFMVNPEYGELNKTLREFMSA